MREVIMIDPPGGWQYGFPKPCLISEEQSFQDWLIEHGYPQSEIDVRVVDRQCCQIWIIEVEDFPPARLDPHVIGARVALIMTRIHVAAIRASPASLVDAQHEIDGQLASHRATVGHRKWRVLLRQPLDEIIAAMLERSRQGDLLRSNSPFSLIFAPQSEAERRDMWRKAKAELMVEQKINLRS